MFGSHNFECELAFEEKEKKDRYIFFYKKYLIFNLDLKFLSEFLVAKLLYNYLCPSARPSVRLSVRQV